MKDSLEENHVLPGFLRSRQSQVAPELPDGANSDSDAQAAVAAGEEPCRCEKEKKGGRSSLRNNIEPNFMSSRALPAWHMPTGAVQWALPMTGGGGNPPIEGGVPAPLEDPASIEGGDPTISGAANDSTSSALNLTSAAPLPTIEVDNSTPIEVTAKADPQPDKDGKGSSLIIEVRVASVTRALGATREVVYCICAGSE